jgi:hypothetical protein
MSGIAHHRASPGVRAWRVWREWRRSRPFWGGLLVLLGGVEILFTVWAPLGVVLHVGMQNFIGYLVPYVIILLGLLLWFNPAQRIFYSLIAMLCALGSWLTSNMGGFVFGLLLTLVGAALAFAWAPAADLPGGDPALAASGADLADPAAAAPGPDLADPAALASGPDLAGPAALDPAPSEIAPGGPARHEPAPGVRPAE